ncbi:MAG: glucose/galactose MFS transporter [Gammaproteobacteria bacterium MedPE]|nr:MAG: glucose/galactose MFS transporter [Gammaproteobacteria bacterium MedPE]
MDSISQQVPAANQNYRFSLISLTSLFFMWGFITCLNDILIPHLKGVFSLTYAQAMLIQFCFFGAYFIVSLPAGMLVKKVGYKKGIVIGLTVASIGCLLFYPAAQTQVYGWFLGALFVLASGITVLQVSANPYVTELGDKDTAASRLTMTQAFNSLGTTIAPYFGGLLILSAVAGDFSSMNEAQRLAQAQSVQMPYVTLAAMLLILAAIFSALKLPEVSLVCEDDAPQASVMQYPHLLLGAGAIFMYVGAEVAIGSLMVNFLGESNIAGLVEHEAAKYITYYWGGALVGRFLGALIMQKIAANKALAFNAISAMVLLLAVSFGQGNLAMFAILSLGLCNSIMFPTIFSLAVNGLGAMKSKGAGLLCLAIVGGALVPLLQGVIADSLGLQLSFLLPIICYGYILHYALKGFRA